MGCTTSTLDDIDNKDKTINTDPASSEIDPYEIIAFGYIRLEHEMIHHQLIPTSLKRLIQQFSHFAIDTIRIGVYKSIYNETLYQLQQLIDETQSGEISYNQSNHHLTIRSNGNIKIKRHGLLAMDLFSDDGYQESGAKSVGHLEIICGGDLIMDPYSGLVINLGKSVSKHPGRIDIKCRDLYMDECSYISACGSGHRSQWRLGYEGCINIDIARDLYLGYGEGALCAIMCYGSNHWRDGGDINISIGGTVVGTGLWIDVSQKIKAAYMKFGTQRWDFYKYTKEQCCLWKFDHFCWSNGRIKINGENKEQFAIL